MLYLKQLCIPLTYLRIRHEAKFRYDFVYPILLALITLVIFFLLPDKPSLLGTNGYLDVVQKLIYLLIPFFIAALAAIATFDRPSMDEDMKGTPPYLFDKDDVKIDLTRRRFLSYLFGYLSFVSIIMFLITLFIFMFLSENNFPYLYENKNLFKAGFLFFHSLIFWNLIITSLVGLFFLTENIHSD